MAEPGPNPVRILFSDLDGTLLSEDGYSAEPALPALRRLQAARVQVVLCTSKTFAETLVLHAALGLADPVIVENGGAVYLPDPTVGWRRLPLGIPYDQVTARLQAIARRLGLALLGFAQMPVEAVAAACGLGLAEAGRSKRREFDEPFSLTGASALDRARFAEAVRAAGLALTEGGRFLHASGPHSKGAAIRHLLDLRPDGSSRPWTAAIGDSPNDLPMFQAVDRAYLVQRPGGTHHPEVLASGTPLCPVPGIGPWGWALAANDLLGQGLPPAPRAPDPR